MFGRAATEIEAQTLVFPTDKAAVSPKTIAAARGCFSAENHVTFVAVRSLTRPGAMQVCEERWKDVHNRVVEHNIRVISKCYDRIPSARLGSPPPPPPVTTSCPGTT